jgi:hypothetical protein
MGKKDRFFITFGILLIASLSCTNPVDVYLSTQIAVKETATAAMWSPTYTVTLTHTPTLTLTHTPTGPSTLTPTGTHTNMPTFTRTQYPIFYEDFEDISGGWRVSDSEYALRGYFNGGYRIMVKKSNWVAWALPPNEARYTDIRIEVDAIRLDGPDHNVFGVICRYQDDENQYGLEISSVLGALIYKRENNEFIPLSSDSLTEVEGIRPDDWNHIVAVCRRDTLELYANGILVAKAWDDSFDFGQIALVTGNIDAVGADILFDNLYVYSAQ